MELYRRLTDLETLETLLAQGGVPAVLDALEQGASQLPPEDPQRRNLMLLHEAVSLDATFLERHPQHFFACLYHRAWWYDCPDASAFYAPPGEKWKSAPPWKQPGPLPLHQLMEAWRRSKEHRHPQLPWLRSLKPPTVPLGFGPQARLPLPPNASSLRLSFHDADTIVVQMSHWRELQTAETSAIRWHWRTGACEAIEAVETPRPSTFTQSPNQRFVFECYDHLRPIGLYDAQSGKHLVPVDLSGQVYDADMYSITDAHFSPDGRWLAIHGWEDDYYGFLAIYRVDLPPAKPTSAVSIKLVHFANEPFVFDCLGFSGDSSVLAFSTRRRLALLQTGSWKERVSYEGINRRGAAFSLNHDATLLALQDDLESLSVWDIARLSNAPIRNDVRTPIGAVAFSPSGDVLYTQPWLFDAKTGALIRQLNDPVGNYLEGGPPQNNTYLADTCLIRVEIGISRISIPEGKSLPAFEGHSSPRRRDFLVYPQDGSFFASATPGFDTIQLYFFEQERIHSIEATNPKSMALSPDGRRLIVGSDAPQHIISIFDPHTRARLGTLKGHNGPVNALYVSRDNRLLAAASEDDQLCIWDLESLQCIASRPLDERDPMVSNYTYEGGESIEHTFRSWNPTPEALEEIHGWHDFQALHTLPPWRVSFDQGAFLLHLRDEPETLCAAFPAQGPIVAHPHGRIWANDQHHLILEGDPLTPPPTPPTERIKHALEEAIFLEE